MSVARVGEEGRFLAAIVLAYFAFYGAFLLATDGLPYVLDNNESFSSLWHAANLYNFGISNSFGLADEAFAFHSAAHPYVHTHQGNFPRVFAYLIYLLGARSIEAQIVVTTFTVGLAAIMFAYRFFATAVTPLFAFLACLILITDYMLVAQWQVVTYRVWYEFFVFSSALCVHACANRFRWWQVCTCINFACLFYFEFIFVAFVTLGVALYAVIIVRDVRHLMRFFAWICAGAAIGLGLLLTQLLLFLGWEDLKRDAYLTFVARNRYLNDPGLLEEMKEFFSSRNIVFWYNLEEGSRYRRPGFFLGSLTRHEFQLHTPLLTSIAGILIGGFLAGMLIPIAARFPWAGTHYVAAAILVVGTHLAHKLWRGEFGPMQLVPAIAMAGVIAVWASAKVQIVTRSWWKPGIRLDVPRVRASAAMVLLLLALPSVLYHVSATHFSGTQPEFVQYSNLFTAYIVIYAVVFAWILYVWAFGEPLRRAFSRFSVFRVWLKYPVFIVATVSMLAVTLLGDWAFGIKRPPSEVWWQWIVWIAALLILLLLIAGSRVGFLYRVNSFATRGGPGSFDSGRSQLVFSLSIFLASVALLLSWVLYDQSDAPLWDALLSWSAPGPIKYVLIYLAVLIGAFVAATHATKFLGEHELRGLKTLGIFLACAFASYCVVYMLSPGYIFSGYKVRYAPFSVFHTNTLLALAAFVLVVLARRNTGPSNTQVPQHSLGVVRGGAAVLLALLAWYWAAMQLRYFQLMPADNYHFLKRLDEPPYKGKSFIVSNYAAPIAASTGQWAYLHSGLSNNRLTQEDGRYVVELDPTYLWFADKKSNPAYRRPDYFICATPPNMWSLNQMVRAKAGLSRHPYGCAENVLVRLAAGASKGAVIPAVRLVEVDAEGPSRVGFQRWAIVQLLWDAGN